MKIEEITVHAGRTLQHPTMDYSNLRPSVSMRAVLDEGENASEAIKTLQKRAEVLVEEHAALLIASLQERDIAEKEAREIMQLENSLHRQTQRIEELKEKQASRTMPEWLQVASDE